MKIANILPYKEWFVVGLLLASSSANALDNFKEFKRDHWDFEVETQYFRSEANYVSGSSQSLTSGNYFQLLDFNFSTRYMPRQSWSVFASGKVSNSESKNSLATRTNSTFSEAAVGMDFMMYNDLFQLVPEFIAVAPLEKVDPTSDNVLNSEGVFEVRSRLIAQKDFGGWLGYSWLGYNYRGDGRSFLMPWGFGAQWKLASWRLGVELFGYQSVSDDTDTNSTTRNSYINSVNAGSYKFYSYNPSWVDSQVLAQWKISKKWNMQFNAGSTLTGDNSANGLHVGASIRYSFDLTEGYTEDSYVPVESAVPNYKSNMYDNQIGSDKEVPNFKEETNDGVDQKIFKPKPTQKPKVVDPSLQQQLDNTEFQIELKTEKKKKRRK